MRQFPAAAHRVRRESVKPRIRRSIDMMRGRTSIVVAAMAALAFTAVGRADDKGKDKAVQDATVQFAMPQPQPPQAGVRVRRSLRP